MIELRNLISSDIPRIAELCNDQLISEFIPTIPYPYTLENAEFFYNNIVLKETEEGKSRFFAICEQSSSNLIGQITIHFDQNKHFVAMIGYWMGSDYRGKGYMSEALKRVIQICFDEYDIVRVYATHDPKNIASGKVMLKAGMDYEGTLKAVMFYHGKYRDSSMYSIINPIISN